MALLTFKSALNPIKLTMLSRHVPIMVGDRGIGKTSMARQIARDLDAHFAWIDGNLLKEGEIGGLPTVKDMSGGEDEYNAYLKKVYANGKKALATADDKELAKLFKHFMKAYKDRSDQDTIQVTVYAIHHIIQKVIRWSKENPGKKIVLLIDEINRCEHAVQQELMNLILNREINGTNLPEEVMIIAAMNPSNKFEEFKDSNYQTVDMDDAQEDRMRWFFVTADDKTWLDWATTVIDEETGETNIDPEICEFIASNPDVLNQPNSTDDIKPSPRSWHRSSDSYKLFKTLKGFTQKDMYNVFYGDLGRTVTMQLTQHLANNSNPLIKPEEFLEGAKDSKLPKDIRQKFENETLPRKLMIVKNAIRWLLRAKKTENALLRYTEMLLLMPKDLMVMVMMTTLNEHNDLHKKLVNLDEYLDAFHNVDKLVD